MATRSASPAGPPVKHVLITRTFDAPRALVFSAWASAERMVRWFAPSGCTIEYRRYEFRAGGAIHSCIRTPTGYTCWVIGTFKELVPNERIVMTMIMSNERGEPVNPADIGMDPSWPAETTVTITLAEHAGKTTLTLHQNVDETLAKRTGAHPSWLQMFDRLAELVAQR